MNCQEFRAKWPHTDEATLSHASACADCLHWVESLASEEEVLYMKEVPRPSSQLEERIMRAIYQTAAHPTIPQLPDAREEFARAGRAWRRMLFRRASVWAGAAAFILAAGLWGLLAVEQNREAEQQASLAGSGATADQFAAREIAPASPVPEGGHATAQSDAAAPNPVPFALSPDTPVSSPAGNTALQPPETMASEPASQPSGAAATSQGQPPDAPALTKRGQNHANAKPEAPVRHGIAADPASLPAGQAKAVEPAKQEVPPAPANTFATAGEPDAKIAAQPGDSEQPVSLEEAQAQGITISSFKDAQSAALVSDLPVPQAKALPQGFVLRSLSLRYASETSSAVTHISAVYERDGDGLIALEVDRNDREQRPLSIPGTFARREVFAIDGRQAIGVTYHSAAGAPAEHAVHVILEKDGIPLYVTATARGVSLTELMEVVKQLEWKKKLGRSSP